MKMQPVKSSNVVEVGHDPETNTLAVRYKSGGLYHGSNFSAADYEAIVSADSVGSTLHTHKSAKDDEGTILHPFIKIEEEKHGQP